MDLPADLREGWWWVRWEGSPDDPDLIYLERAPAGKHRVCHIGSDVGPLFEDHIGDVLALEPVAPPSWERGE